MNIAYSISIQLIFEHTLRIEWVGGGDRSSGIKDRAGRATLYGLTMVVAARINLENEGRGPGGALV